MSECLFCEIVRGASPASVIHGDERCMAFLDIQPVNPGHILIVPKIHAAGLKELPEETGSHLFRNKPRRKELDSTAEKIRSRLQEQGDAR